jgi:hypothetical protein
VTDPYPRIHHAKFRTTISVSPRHNISDLPLSLPLSTTNRTRLLTCSSSCDAASRRGQHSTRFKPSSSRPLYLTHRGLTNAQSDTPPRCNTLQQPTHHPIPTYNDTEVGIAQLVQCLCYVVDDRRIVVRFLTVTSRKSKMAPGPAQHPDQWAWVGGGGFFWAKEAGA